MIVKELPKRKHGSSAKRLQEYLTRERIIRADEPLRNADGSFEGLHEYLTRTPIERKLRGDVILSSNFAGLDTVAIEMEGVASRNRRCKDPILHYEISWPHDEHPTKAQWADCAMQTLKALGYEQHQFLIVAHEDKKHFHIHIMVNTVHPDTFKVHNPYRSWTTLDKTVRALEAKYGWKHTPGLTAWDSAAGKAVDIKYGDRYAARRREGKSTAEAQQFEHYNDIESMQNYIRKEIAPSVKHLLQNPRVRWNAVHELLAKAHLRLEKGEKGGYTVVQTDQNIRVKASDVFRNNFAGKANRVRVETLLGPWEGPNREAKLGEAASPPGTAAAQPQKQPLRDKEKRDSRRVERQEERQALRADYLAYKNKQIAECQRIMQRAKTRRQEQAQALRIRKKEIRARNLVWATKKILLSEATAESVKAMHGLNLTVQAERKAATPVDYRSWVEARAAEGDTRAAAQLRGWHYQDQRNLKKLQQRLEPGAFHIEEAQGEEADSNSWADFQKEQLERLRQRMMLDERIRKAHIYEINRRTGDVSYSLNGTVSVIDRGKILTVLNDDEAAIVFGLEMSIKKYGTRLTSTGSSEWKNAVARAVVKNGIYVQFVDPELHRAIEREQRSSSPVQRQVLRLGALKDQFDRHTGNELTFHNETDLNQLLVAIHPAGNAKQVLQIIRYSTEANPQVNYGGIVKISRAGNEFRISILPDKRQLIQERLAKALETTKRTLASQPRIRSREGMDR